MSSSFLAFDVSGLKTSVCLLIRYRMGTHRTSARTELAM